MNEWKEYKLGDLIKTNNNTIGKEYPFSKIKYLDTGSITCNNIVSLQEFELKDAPSRAKRLVVEDDIIYSTVRPNQLHYGFIKNPVKNLVVSTGFVTITCNKNKINPLFLFYNLTQNQNTEFLHSIAEASTSTYPSLKPSDIESLDITLPPLSEQKAIANVLSSLDDKINLLHRQNATLEKMAETLFRQWFVEEAKEDWEEKKLGDIIDLIVDNRGKTPPTVSYQTSFPLIEVNALNSNSCMVNFDVIRKYVTKETFQTWFRKHLKKNDIIISTVGTIGIFALHLLEKGCIAQNLIGLRSNSISSFFIYNFLKINKEKLFNLDIGGVQPSIKVPHLLDLKIIIPPIELISNFDLIVNNYFKKISNNQIQINSLTQIRETLLPKLMSGEVRVEIGGEE